MPKKREALDIDVIESVISTIAAQSSFEQSQTVPLRLADDYCEDKIYFYNASAQAILVPFPILTTTFPGGGSNFMPVLQDTLQRIRVSRTDNERSTISGILMGFDHKNDELHYTAFHYTATNQLVIFDSKSLDIELYLNDSFMPGENKSIGLNTASMPDTAMAQVQLIQLETEHLRNHVDCGYHAIGALKIIMDCLCDEASINAIIEEVIRTKHEHLPIAADYLEHDPSPFPIQSDISMVAAIQQLGVLSTASQASYKDEERPSLESSEEEMASKP